MAGGISIADVLKLPIADRLRRVEDFWDSIVAVPEAVPLTDAQRQELDRRLDGYHRDPRAGSPWPQVRKRIKATQ